jgi:hypothetical protein
MAADIESRGSSNSISISGTIATLLGLYLIGSGVVNIGLILNSKTITTQQSAEMLRQAGVESRSVPIAIIISYVIGVPIFLGSGLLALGSIANSLKEQRRL